MTEGHNYDVVIKIRTILTLQESTHGDFLVAPWWDISAVMEEFESCLSGICILSKQVLRHFTIFFSKFKVGLL